MKIRDKLLLTFITIALSFGVLGYIEHRYIGEVADAFQSLETRRAPALTALLELITATRRASIKAMEYAMRGNPEDRAKAHEALAQIDQQLQRFLALNQDNSGKPIIDDLVARKESFIQVLDDYLQQMSSRRYSVHNIYTKEEELHAARKELIHTFYPLIDRHYEEFGHTADATSTQIKQAIRIHINSHILVTVIAILAGILLARSISTPLNWLSALVNRFGRGELIAPEDVPVKGVLEIRQLGQAVSGMIRERHALEKSLKEREAFMRMLLDTSPVGLALVRRDGTLIEVNPAYARIIGRSVEETLGLTYWEITPEEHSEQEQAQLESLDRTGRYGPYEKEYLHRDGHRVPVRLSRLLMERDGTQHVWSVVEDITEHKQATAEINRQMQALRANERRLTLLLNTLPHGIQEYDTEGVITYSNIAHHRILGCNPGKLIGRHIWDSQTDSRYEQELRDYLAYLVAEQPSPEPYITRNVTKDGRELILEITWDYQRNAEGAVTSFISVVSDVTAREQAEQALKRSETRYRELVENMSAAVVVYEVVGDGEDFIFKEYNRAGERIGGLPRDLVIGRSAREIFPGLVPMGLFDTFRRVWRSGKPERHPVNMYHDERLTLWMESYVFKLPSGEIVGVYEDTTERKKAETALMESEGKFRNLVESSQDWVWEIDTQGVYTYASPRCRDLLGYAPEEIVGRTPFDLMPAAEAKRVQAEFQQNVAEVTPITTLENINLHKDGREVVLETSCVPFFDENSTLVGYRGIDRDITDRKQAEQALRESEARYRVVFNQQFQFMAILSPDGTTLEINELPLRVTGCKRQDFVGKPIWRSPSWKNLPEWQEIWQKRLAEAAGTEGPIQTDDIYQTLDGTSRYADATTTAIRDKAGNILFFLVQASDTTERRRAEQELGKLMQEIQQLNMELEQRVQKRTAELKAVNTELESFAYSVSHDLRAPLRAIDGFSLALAEDYGNQLNDSALDYLQRVRNGAQRMGMLIDDLLQLSRVNRGELSLQEVDLGEIAVEVVQELRVSEPERRVEFTLGRDMRVKGDPRLVRVMLDNLMGNAWKFTAREAVSCITFEHKTDQPGTFYISDNGVGFDMRYADKLFGAFQRLHRVTDFPGTGVGLATVQRIVHRHGGQIWAEAQEGEGATFCFSLAPAKISQAKPTT